MGLKTDYGEKGFELIYPWYDYPLCHATYSLPSHRHRIHSPVLGTWNSALRGSFRKSDYFVVLVILLNLFSKSVSHPDKLIISKF
jgi:hypothetical protein